MSPDDRLLLLALQRRGIRAQPTVWDDSRVVWTDFDAIVVRSCWDYHLRLDEFHRWIDERAREDVMLWNPPTLLHWNADKRYLHELEESGVPVVPTRWVERGASIALEDIAAATGWTEAVVKPAVSASAFSTWRVSMPGSVEDAARFRGEVEKRTMMVQPLLEEVARDGELSVVFLGESFSHAVVKRPKPGDFRVQHEHGGSAELIHVPDNVIADAAEALRAAPAPTLYARVDGCLVNDRFVLMELELLEPSLFLQLDPSAAERLADLVARAVSSR